MPQAGSALFLSSERLTKHLLVCGATGSGKTETLLRLAWAVASESDAPVFYLDAKGDQRNAERFCGLMADAGRSTRVLPNEPFDGWRGLPNDIHGRLMQVIDYSSDGPASWYRDIAKTTLRLVCDQPAGPPRSSRELLDRMDLEALKLMHPGSTAVAALTDSQVGQVRLRYEAFFGQCGTTLDGGWAWEDTRAAYLMVNSLTLQEEAAGLARYLLEDYSHYFTARKPRDQFCVLIVDEFSSVAGAASMAARVEQARGFNASLVLAPQVLEGMGGETETARILGSVETVIAHRVNTPDPIVALAGTRQRPTLTTRLDEEGLRRERTVRMDDRLTIDPNKVRSLPPGVAYVISHGLVGKAQILQAPGVSRGLPPLERASSSQMLSKEANISRPKPVNTETTNSELCTEGLPF